MPTCGDANGRRRHRRYHFAVSRVGTCGPVCRWRAEMPRKIVRAVLRALPRHLNRDAVRHLTAQNREASESHASSLQAEGNRPYFGDCLAAPRCEWCSREIHLWHVPFWYALRPCYSVCCFCCNATVVRRIELTPLSYSAVRAARFDLLASAIHQSVSVLPRPLPQPLVLLSPRPLPVRLKAIPLIMFLLSSRLLSVRKLLSSRPLPVPPSSSPAPCRSFFLLFARFIADFPEGNTVLCLLRPSLNDYPATDNRVLRLPGK